MGNNKVRGRIDYQFKGKNGKLLLPKIMRYTSYDIKKFKLLKADYIEACGCMDKWTIHLWENLCTWSLIHKHGYYYLQ